ncbi:hypothetical protein Tco_1302869 [Tanacetum coccineum]
MWDITAEDVERIRQLFTPNVPDVMVDIIQPLIPKTIHTTPPDEDYVAPATKSILDDLLEEFKDEILNVAMVDEGAECSHTKDLEELERLLTKDPQSHYMEIQVHLVIINPEPFIHTQLMSPEWCLLLFPPTLDPKATKWFKRLVAYAKCNRDSYEIFLAAIQVMHIDWFLIKLQGSIPNQSSWMLYSDDELLEKWMLLEEADLMHVVSSSYRSSPAVETITSSSNFHNWQQ